MKKTLFSRLTGYVAIFLGMLLLVYIRFHQFCPSVFYGDDLANYLSVQHVASGYPSLDALVSYIGTKFRPIFTLALTAETLSFGKNLSAYLAVNFFIAAASGLAIFLLFSRLARDTAVALALAIVVMTSRFALYQVTQVTGQVESIPFFFFVLTLLFAWHAVHESNIRAVQRYEWLSLGFAILAFHTHERYIVILPWLAMVFCLTRRNVATRHRGAWFAVLILAIVENVLVKKFYLHASFFEGTGGTSISLSIPSMLDLGFQAILSIFGINWGPDYLVGADWRLLSIEAQIAGLVFCSLASAAVVVALRRVPRQGKALVSFPWLLVLCAAMLLAPAMATIRMEQRWELAPFFILLCLVAILTARAKAADVSRPAFYGAIAALVVAQVVSDSGVTPAFPKMAMEYEATFARSVKDVVMPRVASRNVYIIGDYSHCNWALLADRGFFVFYERSDRRATCVQKASDAPDDGSPVFRTDSHSKLIEVTDQVRREQSYRKQRTIDLVDKFREAKLLNDAPEDTPTRAGVFVWEDVDWLLGRMRTLTVLSTHGIEYANLPRTQDASLRMTVGMLFPTKSYSEVIVKVRPQSGGAPSRVITLKLPVQKPGAMRGTTDLDIPLPELAKSNSDVSISIATPSGDLNAAWAGFTSLRLSYP